MVAAFRDTLQGAARRGRRRGALPRPPRGHHRAGGQAQDHRHGVHPRLRGGGREARQPALPRAGHALLGRDRVGRRPRRGHDQVAPQRRRACPEDLQFELVEPLRALFKDEVRQVGARARAAGAARLAPAVPGPGPRRSGSSAARSRRSGSRSCATPTSILQDEIRSAGLYRELWQSFCVLPGDLRTVGVQGDERTYGYVVVIRAVTSDDAMTADWARLPYDLIEKVASRMINEIRAGEPGGAGRHVEAARHDRVGISRAAHRAPWGSSRGSSGASSSARSRACSCRAVRRSGSCWTIAPRRRRLGRRAAFSPPRSSTSPIATTSTSAAS